MEHGRRCHECLMRNIMNEMNYPPLPCRYTREAGAGIPGGFCIDCNIPFRAGGEAYRHFTSKLHRSKTRDKKRCYLCSAYVVHMKQHLENTHVTDVFQCRVKNCFQPKFLEIVKVSV